MSDLLPEVILPETPDEGGLDRSDRAPDQRPADYDPTEHEPLSPVPESKVKEVSYIQNGEIVVDTKEVSLDVLPAPEVKQVKMIIEDEEVFTDPKPKKQRSQKQMDHLKKAREKALATRRAKIKARKDAEEESQQNFQSSRPRREEVVDIPETLKHISPDELIELQQKAIEGYDTKRKQRKADKKKKKEADNQASKTYESLAKAIHQPSHPDPDDVWALCFQ
jgi:hypothetical protein